MKGENQKKLVTMVYTTPNDWLENFPSINKLIYDKMKGFFDHILLDNLKYYGDNVVGSERIEFEPFRIFDISPDAYDILIIDYRGYYGKYFGSQDIRLVTKEIIQKALHYPDKIFLLLTGITETETIELSFECLPDEDICLPNNIFFNWDDFIN